MYSVSEEYANKIISNDRAFAIRLTFDSSTEPLTGTTIQDISVDEITNSTDALTMGCACSNKITINLINPPVDIAYEGARFVAEVGLLINDRPITYEWVSVGVFYGADPETNNDFKNLKLTAYDGFYKMTGKYEATVPSETTLQAVYDDLREQLFANCGIILKERVLPAYSIPNFPYLDITYTQAIGYVAGCLGGFARFDRNGELEIATYVDFGTIISREMQYMNGFKRTTDKSLEIASISTGTNDAPIVRGEGANGTNISFENPYITEEMADDIFAAINHFSYTPCQIKWRGDPAVQAGDIVHALDKDGILHTVLVMNHSFKVGGGCNATIDSKGSNATKSEFTNSYESVGQKIERMYSTLERAILDATNAITGNKGGYVKMLDTDGDGSPDEIVISDLPDLTTATKVWRWNKEGLGYAYNPAGNAYSGPYRTAMTSDGQINADFITTGHLSANRISVESHDGNGVLTDYIHFGDGYLVFGEADNAITLKLENDKIAFYNGETRIAYFSNNSFVIENFTEMRLQNLVIMPRASGNITFNILK